MSSVAFSPGGHTLADAAGSEIQLWNTAGPGRPRPLGTAIGPLPYRDGHVSTILSIAFSSDSRTLAAGAADNYVHLWNVANPAQPVSLGYLPEHTESVTSVAFSSRGNILAAGSADDTAIVWNVTDPADCQGMYEPLAGDSDGILSVAVSPDGHTLATASADHTVRLWNLPRTVATGHSNYVDAVALSRTRAILASAAADGTMRLWNVSNLARLVPLSAPIRGTGIYDSVAFSPSGRILAAADNAAVQLWQTTDPQHPTLIGSPLLGFGADVTTSYISSLAFSPDGHTIAAGSFDHAIRLWNVTDLSHPSSLGPALHGPSAGVQSVAFSPDGRVLAAGSLDHTIWFWNITDPAHPVPLGAPLTAEAAVESVAFSPDGRTLASGNQDGTVQLWNVSDPARAAS